MVYIIRHTLTLEGYIHAVEFLEYLDITTISHEH